MRDAELRVLHVAATGQNEAIETLRHTARALSDLGVEQVLLLLDEGLGAGLTPYSGVPAELRTLPCARYSVAEKVRALQGEFSALSLRKRLYAVHFHGTGPCLIGSRALKGSRLQSRILHSPHLADGALPWSTALTRHLLQSHLDPLECSAVTASLSDAQGLSKLLNRSADVLPDPIGNVFFKATREEGVRPSVIADGSGTEAIDMVARLSVLVNGRDARIAFSWLGEATPGARAQLEAAGVRMLDPHDDARRAQLLATTWAFLHISSGKRVPVAIAQAMAAGVPCLVSDTPANRILIRHGVSGFICTSERDLLDKLILLLRDRDDREHVGQAARAEAERCFSLRHFNRAVLRAYGFSRGMALQGRSAPSAARLHAC